MEGDYMVQEELIKKKLKELDKYLKQLKKYEEIDKKELEANLDKLWIVERGLQLCIQIVLDIGNHILSEEGITVDEYGDIIKKLIQLEILPEKFTKIKGMAGFRNILVHEYADVDIEIVTEILNNSLVDFSKFATYIDEYLEKGDTDSEGKED